MKHDWEVFTSSSFDAPSRMDIKIQAVQCNRCKCLSLKSSDGRIIYYDDIDEDCDVQLVKDVHTE